MTDITRFAQRALLALPFALAGATPGLADTVTLRYSQWLPATYPLQVDVIDPWLAEITRVTEGRVKVEATPKVVGTVAGQYDVLADGLADVALVIPGYTPGRFPLIEGLELPFLGDEPLISMPISYRAYETYLAPAGLFKEIVPLGIFTGNPAHIVLKSGSISSIGDLAGKKLRSPQQAASDALELLGAVTVTKPMSEVYELASGGMIDGGIIPPDTTLGFNLAGVLKEYIIVPGGMVNTTNMLAFSHDAWNRISAADQEAIRSVSGLTLAENAAQSYDKAQAAAYAAMPGLGMTIQTPPPEFAIAMRERLQPIRAKWIETATKEGLADPSAMITFIETEYAAGKAAN